MGIEYPRYAVEPRVALRLPPPRSAQRGEPFATRRVKEKDTTGGLVTQTFARAGTRTVSNKRAVGEPRGCLKSRGGSPVTEVARVAGVEAERCGIR